MFLKMPDLIEGSTYTLEEAKPYVAEDDLKLIQIGFPKSIKNWPNEDLLQWRSNEPILFEYRKVLILEFESQIQEYYRLYQKSVGHDERVRSIIKKLERGETAYPVFVQKNDPQLRISEGMHRAVAMWLLKAQFIPTFLTKYKCW